mmetsp:Transcript_9598/g.18010  ORF Transcript_9598/g.18010 Transcript_9598/m.18010 type:complete len:188 (-) Transcript_9598:345-908(-)
MASASTSLGCVGGVPLRGQGKQQKHLHGVLASQVVQTRARGRRRTTSLSLRRSCCLRSSLRYKQGGGSAGFLNGVGSQTVSYSWRLRATEGESKSESEQEVDKLIRDITSGTKPETTFKEDRALQELKAKRILMQQAEEEEIKKGQRTAVFTGVISIILGVVYLAITVLLDSRGSTLQPPPPEAFGM